MNKEAIISKINSLNPEQLEEAIRAIDNIQNDFKPVWWSPDDIIWIAKERCEKDIPIEQAKEILDIIIHKHDAGIGINWDVIVCHIDMFFEKE